MKLKHPSNKVFLQHLKQVSADVAEKIDTILEYQRLPNLITAFKKNPYQQDSKGNLQFGIFETGFDIRRRENLLSIFKTVTELEEYLNGSIPAIVEIKTGKLLTEPYIVDSFHVYPDTNILLDGNSKAFLKRLSNIPGFSIDNLPIVKNEMQKGGLIHKFNQGIPEGIYRGQRVLEQRCKGTNPDTQKELTLLFDVITEYFRQQEEDLTQLAQTSNKSHDLAREYANNTSEDYQKMIAKTIQHIRKGNLVNHLADRIITTTSFGFNLLQSHQKSIIISNDRDLLALQESFYEKVLPRYMAKSAKTAAVERDPEVAGKISESDWLRAAKEHLVWARDIFPVQNTTIGLLYTPSNNTFAVKEVAEPLRQYFNGVATYRTAKSDLITEMARSGENPNAIIRRLMNPEKNKPPIDVSRLGYYYPPSNVRPSEVMENFHKLDSK